MKQYTSNQRKKIVLIINKVKNKKAQALKFNIRSYYYWKKKLEETRIVENESRKPKTSPKKYKNKKIINKVIEIQICYYQFTAVDVVSKMSLDIYIMKKVHIVLLIL